MSEHLRNRSRAELEEQISALPPESQAYIRKIDSEYKALNEESQLLARTVTTAFVIMENTDHPREMRLDALERVLSLLQMDTILLMISRLLDLEDDERGPAMTLNAIEMMSQRTKTCEQFVNMFRHITGLDEKKGGKK